MGEYVYLVIAGLGKNLLKRSRWLKLSDSGQFYTTDIGLYYYKDPLIFGICYRGDPFVTSQAGMQ